MKKAIIFDLDGTLWDSTGSAPAIWNRILDKHQVYDVRMTQEWTKSLMGKTMEEIGGIIFPDMSAEERDGIIDEFCEEEVSYLTEHGGILYEGVRETLEALKKDYELYIVSNCQDGYVESFFHAHNLGEYFTDIEMSGRTGMPKGYNIKLLMERNQLEQAFYVGDTDGDERATREAGIPFVWASYGFGTAISPDETIQNLADLKNLHIL